ncbi:serine hydrolase domain-containing protein [Lentiprolixibacter aurantiacus]|uniref:Serine hydrolase n=1 Tax=Lentiprolixibacter aurantiacus TaxID=2993939 RepID=A0AAE3MKA5_9FLAO|nr:serine hydrolase domain-containing protein [Lentiprolixibacter aurantiacus]MCX2718449.1 serine hydrolase [Lentiprolixibacter aurantiacus]
MRRALAKALSLIIVVLIFPSGCKEDNGTEIDQKKEMAINGLISRDSTVKSVEEFLVARGLKGLSVAVFEDYEVIWADSWGFKETGTADSVNLETAFSTASISKGVTATLLAMLEEEGLMDLNVPVNNYLKRWKLPENDFTKEVPVTLEHLLSHMAGTTQHGFADFYEGDTIPTLVESLQGKLPRYKEEISVVFKPGTTWQYSGGGYVIVQMAVEDHLGKSLADLAAERLFIPLGMSRTTMKQPNEEGFPQNVARAHDEEGKLIRTGIPITPQVAPSGMWSTPKDMALFMIEMQKALDGQKTEVISREVAKRVTNIITVKTLGGSGLAWERFHGFGNREWFSHGGANTGTGGYVYGTMEGGNGMVFFGNGPNGIRIPVLDQLRNSIVASHGWHKPLDLDVRDSIPASLLNKVTGSYQHVLYNAQVQVTEENGTLTVNPFFGGIPAQLHYLGDNVFAVEEFPSNLVFQVNPEDGEFYMALKRRGFQGEADYSFKKLEQ